MPTVDQWRGMNAFTDIGKAGRRLDDSLVGGIIMSISDSQPKRELKIQCGSGQSCFLHMECVDH